MKKLKIYLDTSVINHLFADDVPEAKQHTQNLFNFYIKNKVFETYISSVVIAEINDTKDELKRAKLLSVIDEYNLAYLDFDQNQAEIESLANGGYV